MDYTLRQQQILAAYGAEQQRGMQKLIFDEANSLFPRFANLPAQQQLAAIRNLKGLNGASWGGRPIQSGNYAPLSLQLNRQLGEWQWLQSAHEEVIAELEFLVEESAATAKR